MIYTPIPIRKIIIKLLKIFLHVCLKMGIYIKKSNNYFIVKARSDFCLTAMLRERVTSVVMNKHEAINVTIVAI